MADLGLTLTRVRRAPPALLVDVVLGAALLGVNFLNLGGREPQHPVPLAVDVALLVLQTVPLLLRRRWPGTVLAITLGAILLRLLLHLHLNIAVLGILLAIYAVGAYGRPRTRIAAVAVTVAACAGGLAEAMLSATAVHVAMFLAPGAAYGFALLIGDNLRNRRAYTTGLEARTRLLETEREQRARDAVLAERRRIARELHDLVAHHLSAISIQANAATGKTRTDPHRVDAAIDGISRLSDQALTQMRHLLGILREPDDPTQHAPQPTVAQLPDLVRENQRLGLPVTLTEHGTPGSLPPALSLSTYRIVQEALTNVRRHAPAAHAHVTVDYRPHTLTVEIANTAAQPPPAAQPAGHGLIGIRERVNLLGGHLTAGPLSGGGFRILAQFPLPITSP